MELPSSRFFRHAQRLRFRGGAAARACALAAGELLVDGREEWRPRPAASPVAEPLVDISEVVGVSGPNSRGLPWIEYRGSSTS